MLIVVVLVPADQGFLPGPFVEVARRTASSAEHPPLTRGFSLVPSLRSGVCRGW